MAISRLIIALALFMAFVAPMEAAETFSADDLIEGTTISKNECHLIAHAVFVEADGESICIRYYTGDLPLAGKRVVVFFNGDALGTDGHGHLSADPSYTAGGPFNLELAAYYWSQHFNTPIIWFARMGQHGSSGWQGNRRTALEVAITRAALTAIKKKEGITGFDLAGQSAGGMLSIALAASRNDVRCLVLASSPSDFAAFARTFGIPLRTTGRLAHYLPTSDIPALAAKPDLRVIALTDPKDTIVPPPVQTSFVEALRAAGKPVLHVKAHGRGDEHHAMVEQALLAASLCAAGKTDAAIASDTSSR